MSDHFKTKLPDERYMVNDGPFTIEELQDHVESVANVLDDVETNRYESQVTKVAPEGDGYGVLVEYDFALEEDHLIALANAGYIVTNCDDGRAFVTPFSGEIDIVNLHEA